MDYLAQRNRYFIVLGIIIAVLTVCMPTELVFPAIIAGAGLLVGLILISNKEQEARRFLIPAFIAAFLGRVVFVIFFFNAVYIYNGMGQFGDGWAYSTNGGTILDLWLSGKRNLELTKEAFRLSASGTLTTYDFWNAIVYYFTGKNPLSLMFINCLAASLTALFAYNIAEQLCNRKAAIIAFMLTAFWPSLFLWSIQNLKEPLSVLLLIILIWAIVQLKTQFRLYLIFITLMTAIALKEFRLFLFCVFCIAVLVSFLLSWFRSKSGRFLFLFTAVLLPIVILFTSYLQIDVKKILPTLGGYDFSNPASILAEIYQTHSYRTLEARSALLAHFKFSNPLQHILLGMPVMLLIALFAPFPWMLGSMLQVMAVPEMMLFYFFIPAIFSGGKFIIKDKIREGGIVVVYIVVMYLILAVSEGNVGTLFRHRSMVLPFIFILAGIGLFRKGEAAKGNRKVLA